MSSDLDQLWYAARALVRGADPYTAVGPGRQFPWAWPLFYPPTAVILIVPFSFLPLAAARIAFSVVSAGILGFAVGPRWRVLWPMLLSTSYYLAISRNQLAPLILATFWLPALGFVVAAKPNVGLLAVVAQDRRKAILVIGLAASFMLASLVLRPSWYGEWLALARSAPNKEIALLQPGGVLLLAALLLWRTADGRVLLVASLVPQTPSLYDVLPLFALCRTLRQALVLAALTHLLQLVALALGPYGSFDAGYSMLARLQVYLVLLPVLLLALGNHFLWHPPEPIGRASAERGGVNSVSNRLNRILIVMAALGLGLQLWIVFHP